jgi:hypothetical protein
MAGMRLKRGDKVQHPASGRTFTVRGPVKNGLITLFGPGLGGTYPVEQFTRAKKSRKAASK